MQRRFFALLSIVGIFACGREVAGPTAPTLRTNQPVPPPPPADPAIAYGSRTGKGFKVTYGLGVMNADGTNQTVIAAATDAPHPAWSPDGHSILYHTTTYGISRVDVSVVNGVPQASAPVTLPITHLAFDNA